MDAGQFGGHFVNAGGPDEPRVAGGQPAVGAIRQWNDTVHT